MGWEVRARAECKPSSVRIAARVSDASTACLTSSCSHDGWSSAACTLAVRLMGGPPARCGSGGVAPGASLGGMLGASAPRDGTRGKPRVSSTRISSESRRYTCRNRTHAVSARAGGRTALRVLAKPLFLPAFRRNVGASECAARVAAAKPRRTRSPQGGTRLFLLQPRPLHFHALLVRLRDGAPLNFVADALLRLARLIGSHVLQQPARHLLALLPPGRASGARRPASAARKLACGRSKPDSIVALRQAHPRGGLVLEAIGLAVRVRAATRRGRRDGGRSGASQRRTPRRCRAATHDGGSGPQSGAAHAAAAAALPAWHGHERRHSCAAAAPAVRRLR